MAVVEGQEVDLTCIDFHQIRDEFDLCLPEADHVASSEPCSLLAISNQHGLLFFAIPFGFGWTQLNGLANVEKLDYRRFGMEYERTTSLKVLDRWLLVGNGHSIHILDIDQFASDPVDYEHVIIKSNDLVSDFSLFNGKILALVGKKVYEVDCHKRELIGIGIQAKSFHQMAKKLVSVGLEDEIRIHNSSYSIEKQFLKPSELEHLKVNCICCINEWDVIVGCQSEDAKSFLEIYHLDISSSGTDWTRIEDPTRPRKPQSCHLFTAVMNDWDESLKDLVIVSNSSSADIGTLGRTSANNPISSFFLTTEEFLAQLPVSFKNERGDQHPIGIALDLFDQEKRSPIVWILTNEGVLCPYRVVKNDTPNHFPGMLAAPKNYPNLMSQRAPMTPSKEIIVKEAEMPSIPSREPESKTVEAAEAPSIKPEPPSTEPIKFEEQVESTTESQDFGKYTNALIQDFLSLQSMLKNDFVQVKNFIDTNQEQFNRFKSHHGNTFSLIERDTIKVGQDFDNPAFIKLFEFEKKIHDLLEETQHSLWRSKNLESFAGKLKDHHAALQSYHRSFKSVAEDLERKVGRLENIRQSSNQRTEINFEDLTESTDKLKENIKELELNLGLMKLTGRTVKPSSSTSPTKDQILRFAAGKLKQRKPTDCLHTIPSDSLSKKSNPHVSKMPQIEAKYQTRVFPVYDESEWAHLSYESTESLPSPNEESVEWEDISDSELSNLSHELEEEIDDIAAIQASIGRQLEGDQVANVDTSILTTKIEDSIDVETLEQQANHEKLKMADKDVSDLAPSETVEEASKSEGVSTTVESIESDSAKIDEHEDTLALQQQEEREPDKSKDGKNDEDFEVLEPEPSEKPLIYRESNAEQLEVGKKADEDDSTGQREIAEKQLESEQSNPNSEAKDVLEVALAANSDVPTQLSVSDEASKESPEEVIEISLETPEVGMSSPIQAGEPVADVEITMESNEAGDDTPLKSPMNIENDASQQAPIFGGLSLGGSTVAPSKPASSIFGIPSTISSDKNAPMTPSSASNSFGFKPTALNSFAPKLEESPFAAKASPTFGSSTNSFGSFGSSATPSFGQPSTFGSSTGSSSFGGASSSAFGQTSAFGQPSFGSTSSFGQPSAFGSLGPTAPFSAPAKVFGQGNASSGSNSTGFGALAQQSQQPTADSTESQQKKNLPTSFTQFR